MSRLRFLLTFGCLLLLMSVLFAACGDSGSSSASVASNSTPTSNGTSGKVVTIKENHGASGDTYMFDPPRLTVQKGDTVTVQNMSDELQDIDQGDTTAAGVDLVVPINQSGTMTFNKVGTFTLKSEKGATITVTVQ